MKMKYVALLACIVCMITVATAEEEAKSKARLYDAGVAGVTTYAFDGFDFERYKASKHGLDNIIRRLTCACICNVSPKQRCSKAE